MDFLYDGLDMTLMEEDWDAVGDDLPISNAADIIANEPYFTRSQKYWQQMPLPEEVVLSGTNLLASLDDDTLLNMSPSLIAHVQRTEASRGVQVVSPRAITLGGVAARTNETKRTTDMFLVGSAASRNLIWPTVDNDPMAGHFWNEPIDSYPSDPAPRPRTVTSGILSSNKHIDDPITKAFLVGRALVDLQRRPDIAGSAEMLSEVLAKCWNISAEEYEDMGEASLAPVGDLLRYAIRSDTSYPIINAPIHARKCISVGANTAGRTLYGDTAAIDWRRMRVLAESIFYQSSRIENYTLAEMVAAEPPGNPRASPVRPGILQLRPLPGSVWTFDPATFKILVNLDAEAIPAVEVPARVREAVVKYHASARPVAHAAAVGAAVSYVATQKLALKSDTSESLISGFRSILVAHSTAGARGKTAAAAVRSFVYSCLAENLKLSSIRALWMARYMHDTADALNLSHMLDPTTTRHIAARLSDLTSDMRVRLGVEAGRRGSDLENWWKDLSAQLPAWIARMSEGSASWALATAHFMLHPPTDKWAKLVRAMAHASHAALARGHLTDVRLPALLGSPERTFAAAASVTKQLGTSYGAFYRAMYDVTSVLRARLSRAGNHFGAEKLRISGLMWNLRAAVATTVTLHTPDNTSTAAGTIVGAHTTYHLTTSPYSEYQALRDAVNKAGFIKREAKAQFPHHTPPRISEVFNQVTAPLFTVNVGSKSRVYRYAMNPSRLGADIETTLSLIANDVKSVVVYYDNEASDAEVDMTPAPVGPMATIAVDLSRFKPKEGSYWEMITHLDADNASFLIDAVTKMDDAMIAEIEGAMYASTDELEAAVWGKLDDIAHAAKRDAVN